MYTLVKLFDTEKIPVYIHSHLYTIGVITDFEFEVNSAPIASYKINDLEDIASKYFMEQGALPNEVIHIIFSTRLG